ncbi:Chemotaxis protein CheY [Candidatus Magnetobacterium bavaricum]|uniref:Chemotaxis protein CheY n=1 Tax=Candidatus Magnetobacterium bavaricum TaxID=29290 RepID=A0A0F3GXJ5_9BACT|nr:Chemotaxis protein CheY [Candidatus Magnetobacterium bavaricum]
MKIMIVDDDKTTRKILGLYLISSGYEPVYAENGLDAIEKLAYNEVDFILTDLNMPYMDGLELTKTLRADPSFKYVPIMLITTEDDDIDRELAFEADANGYMVKPVTAEAVTRNIKNILKQ